MLGTCQTILRVRTPLSASRRSGGGSAGHTDSPTRGDGEGEACAGGVDRRARARVSAGASQRLSGSGLATVEGVARSEGRNEGHSPRPLGPAQGADGPEGRRYSLAQRPRVRCVRKASTCRQDLFLYLEHAVVWTALPRQLFVGSAFDDPASLEH